MKKGAPKARVFSYKIFGGLRTGYGLELFDPDLPGSVTKGFDGRNHTFRIESKHITYLDEKTLNEIPAGSFRDFLRSIGYIQ